MGAFNDKARRRERLRSQKEGAEALKSLLGLFALPFLLFFWIFKIFFWIFFWPFKVFFKKH